MKLFGAALVTMASLMTGLLARQNLAGRLRFLRQLRLGLELMQSEMETHMVSVPELFEAVGRQLSGPMGELFTGTGVQMAALKGRSPVTAMKLQLEQQAPFLGKQETALLLELATSLGRYDLGGQARTLELYKHQTDALLEEATLDKKQKARAWMTASVCTGLALIVILL